MGLLDLMCSGLILYIIELIEIMRLPETKTPEREMQVVTKSTLAIMQGEGLRGENIRSN